MKVVIANPDKLNLVKMKTLLSEKGYDVVGVYTDGVEALELINQMKPDMLISHVFLKRMDGLTLVNRVRETLSDSITCIMTSPVTKDEIIAQVFECGADYFIFTPLYDETIQQQIDRAISINKKCATQKESMLISISPDNLEKSITDLLIQIGLKTSIKGFTYIREGILMALDDPSILNQITKVLYPSIALKHNSTSTRVERAIRHSIENCFNNGSNEELLADIFGYTTNSKTGKPTNSEFIFLLTDKIRLDNNLI